MDMFVKPREGLKILRPDTRTVLMEVGEHVPKTGFWLRRLKQGDIFEASLKAMKKPKINSKKPSKKKEEVYMIMKKNFKRRLNNEYFI